MERHEITSKNDIYYNSVIDLYDEAFPKEECFPIDDLADVVKRGNGKAVAFVDNISGIKKFVGGAYYVFDKENVMLLFLAIAKSVRGSGYGSRLLSKMADDYPNHKITLQIETTREDAGEVDNMEERIKREAFYIKNGYKHIPLITDEPGGIFDFMVYGGDVTYEEMRNFLNDTVGREYLIKWGLKVAKLLEV